MPISPKRLLTLATTLLWSPWGCLAEEHGAKPSRWFWSQKDDSPPLEMLEKGDVSCKPPLQPRPLEADAPFGALHDLVGRDGVLMISMERHVERYDSSAAKLRKAGIFPVKFSASDGFCDAQQQLRKGCYATHSEESNAKCAGDKWINFMTPSDKSGFGCTSTEQAIADSHRRALLAARNRTEEWTAILEEDAVPVRPERWNRAFRKIWKKIPKETKIVRLSYCMFEDPQSETRQQVWHDAGDFILTKWAEPSSTYTRSGCTGGYLVHKDIIPEMLSIFPCCCALDCCLEWDFFNRKADEAHALTRGMEVLMSMDAWGSAEFAKDFNYMQQNGVLVQDDREIGSDRMSLDKRGAAYSEPEARSRPSQTAQAWTRTAAYLARAEEETRERQTTEGPTKQRKGSVILEGDVIAWGIDGKDRKNE